MFQRYWRVAVEGLGLSFGAGAAVFAVFALTGNSDWRAYLTIGEVARGLLSYGVVALLVGVAATVGAGLGVAAVDKGLAKPARSRALAVAGGAAGGILLLSSGLAVSESVRGNAASGGALAMLGVVLAIVAGLVAAGFAARAESLHTVRQQHPESH